MSFCLCLFVSLTHFLHVELGELDLREADEQAVRGARGDLGPPREAHRARLREGGCITISSCSWMRCPQAHPGPRCRPILWLGSAVFPHWQIFDFLTLSNSLFLCFSEWFLLWKNDIRLKLKYIRRYLTSNLSLCVLITYRPSRNQTSRTCTLRCAWRWMTAVATGPSCRWWRTETRRSSSGSKS